MRTTARLNLNLMEEAGHASDFSALPQAEEIAALIDHALEPKQRATLLAQIAGSDVALDVLADTIWLLNDLKARDGLSGE